MGLKCPQWGPTASRQFLYRRFSRFSLILGRLAEAGSVTPLTIHGRSGMPLALKKRRDLVAILGKDIFYFHVFYGMLGLQIHGPVHVGQPSARYIGNVTPVSGLGHAGDAYPYCMHAFRCLYLGAEWSAIGADRASNNLLRPIFSIFAYFWTVCSHRTMKCDTTCHAWAFRYFPGLTETGEIMSSAWGRIYFIFMFSRVGFDVKFTARYMLVSPQRVT